MVTKMETCFSIASFHRMLRSRDPWRLFASVEHLVAERLCLISRASMCLHIVRVGQHCASFLDETEAAVGGPSLQDHLRARW